MNTNEPHSNGRPQAAGHSSAVDGSLAEGLFAEGEPLWTAVRYVLDELTADEATAFETRLAVDPQAQASVAQAVELLAAYRLAEAEIELETIAAVATSVVSVAHPVAANAAELRPADRVSHVSGWPAVGWSSLGVAACLALLITWQTIAPAPQQLASAPGVDDGRVNDGRVDDGRLDNGRGGSDSLGKVTTSPEMAITWARLTAENLLDEDLSVDDVELNSLESSDLQLSQVSHSYSYDDATGLEETSVPNWMLLAIESPQPAKN